MRPACVSSRTIVTWPCWRVESDSFFNGLEPLDVGELPKVRSTVITYGYPAGGEQISYTRGVVSRIELQSYTHIGNRGYLAAQTDAAINPGNSGGPVIQEDKVVGVAFQGIPGLENTGFFIPPPLIQHFSKTSKTAPMMVSPQAGLHRRSAKPGLSPSAEAAGQRSGRESGLHLSRCAKNEGIDAGG